MNVCKSLYSPLQRQVVKHCFRLGRVLHAFKFYAHKKRFLIKEIDDWTQSWDVDHGFYIWWQALRWRIVGWLNNATLRMRTGIDDSELRANENNCQG